MTARKDELLDSAIHFVIEHGVANLSLRPLAAAIGTSARLLIFHFGTKDRLLAEILSEVQKRFQAVVAGLPDDDGSGGRTPMSRFWDHMTRPANLPLLRVLYAAHFIALENQSKFGPYLADTSRNWIDLIESRLPAPLRNKAIATLCAAVFDGLVIELLGSGDVRRTTQAMDAFIELLVARSRK